MTDQRDKPIARIMSAMADGWMNILTGLGIAGKDKRILSRFGMMGALDRDELVNIYRSNGFGRRIIDLPAREMTREWFKIENDTDDAIGTALKNLDFRNKLTDLIRWSRLFGGSVGVILADDGSEDLSKPLNENNIQEIAGLNIFDRNQVQWTSSDVYDDPKSSKFQQPQWYEITQTMTGQPFRAHESRCLRLNGANLPEQERITNLGWGDSELQKCYDRLRGLGNALEGIEQIIDDFILMILSIDGLSEILAAGNEKLVLDRAQIFDMTRRIANTVILDSKEQYEKKSSTVAGLADLTDRLILCLSSVCEIPVTLLMGQAPAGLNATGDADIRNFYDLIAATQTDHIEPLVNRFIYLLMKSKKGPTKGQEIKQWSIHWNPLWQLSAKEEAEMRLNVANADRIYLEMGVLDPDELRASRFEGEYSIETVLSEKSKSEIEGDQE